MSSVLPMTCPHCGRENRMHDDEAATDVPPVPGDWGVCFNCGEPHVFIVNSTGVGVVARVPLREERADMDADPVMVSALQHVRGAIAMRARSSTTIAAWQRDVREIVS